MFLNFFGKEFELYKAIELNQFLSFSGSNKFLHAGQYGSQMELIFGSGEVKQYHEYKVTTVKKDIYSHTQQCGVHGSHYWASKYIFD